MNTSFTPEQKAFIREVVFEAAPTIVKTHVDSCPWGRKLARMVWVGIGASAVLTFLGLTTLPGVREFMHRITGP